MITRFLPVPASAHASMLDAVLIDVHWHMLAVFLAWLVIFGYVWSIWRRLSQVEQEIASVSKRVAGGARR
mgnify:CR=1 FL=1